MNKDEITATVESVFRQHDDMLKTYADIFAQCLPNGPLSKSISDMLDKWEHKSCKQFKAMLETRDCRNHPCKKCYPAWTCLTCDKIQVDPLVDIPNRPGKCQSCAAKYTDELKSSFDRTIHTAKEQFIEYVTVYNQLDSHGQLRVEYPLRLLESVAKDFTGKFGTDTVVVSIESNQ